MPTVLWVTKRRRRNVSRNTALVPKLISNGQCSHLPDFALAQTPPLCSEFNYVKNANDECVLVPGTTPLADDDSCRNDEDYWYSRTPYRKIPYSSCEGGERPDRGAQHDCPGFKAHGAFFWWFIIMIPFTFTALVGYWYYRRSGLARGYVFLP